MTIKKHWKTKYNVIFTELNVIVEVVKSYNVLYEVIVTVI